MVVGRHSARIEHVSPEEAKALTDIYFRPPLRCVSSSFIAPHAPPLIHTRFTRFFGLIGYASWPTNITYVGLLWIGFIFTVARFVLALLHMFRLSLMIPNFFPLTDGILTISMLHSFRSLPISITRSRFNERWNHLFIHPNLASAHTLRPTQPKSFSNSSLPHFSHFIHHSRIFLNSTVVLFMAVDHDETYGIEPKQSQQNLV